MIGSIKPADLPSPPKTALQVLQACSDESVDYSKITNIVTNDPHLTAEILRMVNSAFYARNNPINSINQAISIIGTNSLRNLCLCLSVKDVFAASDFDGNMLDDFWSDSIYRAVVAKHIAELSKQDPDECFTAGLLQDFGLLILIYLNKDKTSSWYALRQFNPDLRCEKEKSIFGHSHTEVFSVLGREWNLPDLIVNAISDHHQCKANGHTDLCAILNATDWFAYVITADDFKRASGLCHRYLSEHLSLSDEEVDDCFNHISEQVKHAADGMGIKLNLKHDYKDLIQQSNIKLAEDNLNIQELNWKLQQTIEERDRLSAELNREIKLATEVQESLLPDIVDLPVYGLNIPARQLSGDFYDYLLLPDGSILFCLADVSGKGVNASLLMVKTSSLFHCLGKYVSQLDKLVKMINYELVESSIRGMFVTFVCGKYYPSTSNVEIINAGHPPALLIGKNRQEEINSSTFPLGIEKDIDLKVVTHDLKDAALYMVTDGILEALCDKQVFGLDGLKKYLMGLQGLDVRLQLEKFKSLMQSENIDTSDDMTMLIVDGNA